MPKLSQTMEEGQIARWVKNEGDAIEANETIAEVDTDKATMEMTSLEAGTLLKIIIPGGENAKLGQTIGIIGEKGEDFSALLNGESTNGVNDSQQSAVNTPQTETADSEQISEIQKSKTEDQSQDVSETEGRSYDYQRPEAVEEAQADNPKSENGRMIVSPIAARMASENDVNLKSIRGSGPKGRIIKRDIEEAIKSGPPFPFAVC